MIERVAKRCRHGSRESQELFIVAGVARDEAFGHSVGAHRPPLVMIPVAALSEPDLSEVFESPIACDVCRRDMAMVIENGLRLSELEIQLFASAIGE
jgi:hypothetical protein